jgi:predicted RNA-binding Zn-ribbon protein involved in translation (DUF1610 family)
MADDEGVLVCLRCGAELTKDRTVVPLKCPLCGGSVKDAAVQHVLPLDEEG